MASKVVVLLSIPPGSYLLPTIAALLTLPLLWAARQDGNHARDGGYESCNRGNPFTYLIQDAFPFSIEFSMRV